MYIEEEEKNMEKITDYRNRMEQMDGRIRWTKEM